jgi:hypothetical protein
MIDLTNVSADEAIRALILADTLRRPAGQLKNGDNVVYREHGPSGHYVHAVIDSIAPTGRDNWVRVATQQGESWECSPLNTRCLVVQS